MTRPTVTASDLTWAADDGMFKCRVAALIRHGDDLLVCEMDALDYTFLPGGKVRMGEDTRSALARELAEELGRDLAVGALALVVESLWHDGALTHELCFYYLVAWPDDVPAEAVNSSAEEGHRFSWITAARLAASAFQPAELIGHLTLTDEGVRHVTLDRR